MAGVILDAAGNLYGTTFDFGGVFRLTPPKNPDGAWKFTPLHTFRGGNEDGATPFAGLALDSAGALYGTTFAGGAFNVGVVFHLTPSSGEDSPWNETILHSFSGSVTGVSNDGAYPIGGVTFDSAGAFYGTTFNGGLDAGGTVFKLTPNADRTGTIADFGLIDVKIIGPLGSTSLQPAPVVGGVAVVNNFEMRGVYVSGEISAGDFSAIGGVVGVNDAAMTNCHSTADVKGRNNAWVGGLAGSNNGGRSPTRSPPGVLAEAT